MRNLHTKSLFTGILLMLLFAANAVALSIVIGSFVVYLFGGTYSILQVAGIGSPVVFIGVMIWANIG